MVMICTYLARMTLRTLSGATGHWVVRALLEVLESHLASHSMSQRQRSIVVLLSTRILRPINTTCGPSLTRTKIRV